jgi:hypothetical protein
MLWRLYCNIMVAILLLECYGSYTVMLWRLYCNVMAAILECYGSYTVILRQP